MQDDPEHSKQAPDAARTDGIATGLNTSRPGPLKDASEYAEHVRSVLASLRTATGRLGEHEMDELADAAYAALVEEAHHELHHILLRMQTQLERGMHDPSTPEGTIGGDHVVRTLGLLDEAMALMEDALTRQETARELIGLDREAFDLAEEFRDHLDREGFLGDDAPVRFPMEPSPIEADRVKLLRALTYLFMRFYRVASNGQKVVGHLRWHEDRIEGFIGLEPSHLSAQRLLSELSQPPVIEEMRIDIPVARAVIERHAGSVRVAQPSQGRIGYAFSLPALDTEWHPAVP